VTELPEEAARLSSDLESPLARPTRQKAFETVVEQLRVEILSGARKVGSKLPRESDLAGLFGVSRTAIREALRVLELQGLVYVYHGYGGGMEFHFILADNSANAVLGSMVRSLWTFVAEVDERAPTPSSRTEIMATHAAHRDIVSAARRGEASQAERMMIAHLLSLQDYYTSQDQ
jgi:DNA-binding FadR family transcriptional regulator